MEGNLEARCRELGRYMLSKKCTIRQVAKAKGMSKSTVHGYLTKYLQIYDQQLYQEVREHLDKNKAERHIRGGQATAKKYTRPRSK